MEDEEVGAVAQPSLVTEEDAKDAEGHSGNVVSTTVEEDGLSDTISVASEELEFDITEKLKLLPSSVSLTTEQKLAWWIAFLPTVKSDVCEELGGNELCWISVESLILRFAAGREVDHRFVEHPRFLELTYTIERFLARLREIGLVFELVFFNCFKGILCSYNASLWAFREVFRLHCAANSDRLPFLIFQDWFDEAYKATVALHTPFVFILEDGSSLSDPSSIFSQQDDSSETDGAHTQNGEAKQPGEHGYAALYSLILNTLGRQMNVALTHKLRISGRRLAAFSVGTELYVADLENSTGEAVMQLATQEASSLNEAVSGVWDNEIKCGSFRLDAFALVAREMLSDDDFGEEEVSKGSWTLLFIKALIIHENCLSLFSLGERTSAVVGFQDIVDYTTSLEFFCANLQQLLSCLEGVEDYSVDFLDEAVLRQVIASLIDNFRKGNLTVHADFFGMSKEAAEKLNGLWRNKISNSAEAFFPIQLEFLTEEDSVIHSFPELLFDEELTSSPGSSGDYEPIEPPSVLPVIGNDFLSQMSSEENSLSKVIAVDGSKLEQRSLAEKFQGKENKLSLLGGSPDGSDDPPYVATRFTNGYCMDVAVMQLEMSKPRAPPKPRGFASLSGSDLIRATRRWEQRKMNETRVRARDLNKHFGFLDALHLPMMLIGGKAQSSHPWVVQRVLDLKDKPEESNSIASGSKKSGKAAVSEAPGVKVPKKSAKAVAIIAKNQEKQAEKKKNKESDVNEQLNVQLQHILKKKCTSPAVFNEALRELLLGTRAASDTTVLEDFPGIFRVLTIEANQTTFLTALADKICDVLEYTFTYKTILMQKQLSAMLQCISLIFRFVHITIEHLGKTMNGTQVGIFQTLLRMLGFKNSARAVFDQWAQHVIDRKFNEAKLEKPVDISLKSAQGRSKVGKADGKKSASSAKVTGPSEREISTYKKKLESEGFVTSTRPFAFAVKPGFEATFQMKYMGADMSRTLGSIKDPRVAFTPDGWQKLLLDSVDSLTSSLVVAPTASGKTFACYYAMDQVLRLDNESCVVFVSPARALALQVHQEVTARFSKKVYPACSTTVLHGLLLEGDRWQDWSNSQILITVPSALRTILCSTDAAIKKWQTKLRFAILDEIHCVGEARTEKEYENLIQMLPCPFMALSATVGNEADFAEWLSRAQSYRGAKPVTFIKHDERYADLQTSYYHTENQGLYNINPISCVDYDRLKESELPKDFTLVPTDLLQIYVQIRDHLKSIRATIRDEGLAVKVDYFIKDCDPEEHFAKCPAITKKQYRAHLGLILSMFREFIVVGLISQEDFLAILREGQDSKRMGRNMMEPWWSTAEDAKTEVKPVEDGLTLRAVFESSGNSGIAAEVFGNPLSLLGLIKELEAQKMMPALVFNFNRATTCKLFYKVLSYLVDEHYKKFYGTPEATAKTKALNKKKQDDHKAQLLRREEVEKWKTLSKEQREAQGIDDAVLAELSGPAPVAPSDVAEEYDPEFFLCDKRIFLSMQDDFNDIMAFCRIDGLMKAGRISQILVEGLKRGIGLYHDALHREYRRAVEFLFRKRYLRVVLSDISLSLGVNMPCKTTVFAGDSPLLTPLLFRQTAGRAGRRGFDSLGHTVFWEFPLKKIKRLLNSKLAILSGGFAVRPTTALQATVLASNLEADCMEVFRKEVEAEGAGIPQKTTDVLQRKFTEAIDSSRSKLMKLFSVPFYAVGASNRVREILSDNSKVSFRFAIDLVRRLGFLDRNGKSALFVPGVLALAESEPGNLFFFYAILEGVLREYVNKPRAKMEDNLLHLIAFALNRREFTYSIVRRFELARISPEVERVIRPKVAAGQVADRETEDMFVKWSPLVPPLNSQMYRAVRKFDKTVFENAVNRGKSVCLLRSMREDEYTLPVTKVSYWKQERKEEQAFEFASFMKKGRLLKDRTYYRNPFADGSYDVKTVEDLFTTFRDDVLVEAHLVPQLGADMVEMIVPAGDNEEEDQRVPLVNSYILNIVKNGSLRRLIQENEVPASEAYFVILDAERTIGSVHNAISSQRTQETSLVKPAPMGDSSMAISSTLQNILQTCSNVRTKVKT